MTLTKNRIMSPVDKKPNPDFTPIPAKGAPLVLGAGGWNIFHHFGVIQALTESGITPGDILGVSAGGMTATFLTNGFKPDELVEIFLAMRSARENPLTILEGLRIADPISLAVGGAFSIKPFVERLIKTYGLRPNARLRLLACDYFSKEAVVFSGEDYDLATALAASCSVPDVFQPIWHLDGLRPRLLVDGAVYHYNPTEFFDSPAIVSKFRPASRLPREWKWPSDLYFHLREIYHPVAGNHRHVDTARHLVIETGDPEVAGLNFGLSEKTCRMMVENGYNTACEAIARAKREGKLSSSPGD